MSNAGLRVGGRLLGGLLTVAAGAALVWGAVALPDADAVGSEGSAGLVVDPVAVGQQRVCPGPLMRLGDQNGQNATALSSFGSPSTVTSDGTIASALQTVDVTSTGGANASTVQAPADAALLAAAQSQVATEPDQTGLAVASCTESVASSWLVGGATDTGRTTLLLLANPSGVESIVDVTLYNDTGLVQAPGLTDLVVAPGSQRVLSLAGFAPGASAVAARVESRGGLVVPTLQSSVVRGLEPGGTDFISATQPPATDQLIPGLRVTTAALAAARARVGGSTDTATALRVFVPGDADASVSIGVTGDAAGAVGNTYDAEVKAGTVKDIPLTGLGDGTYTVSVQSDVPVATSARAAAVAAPIPGSEAAEQQISYEVIDGGALDASVVAGQRIDLAWFVAAPQLGEQVAFAVADAPGPRLTVTAASGAPAALRLIGQDGSERTLDVAAGSTASLDLSARQVFRVEGASGTVAAVSYAGDGELAAAPLRPASALASPVTIFR